MNHPRTRRHYRVAKKEIAQNETRAKAVYNKNHHLMGAFVLFFMGVMNGLMIGFVASRYIEK